MARHDSRSEPSKRTTGQIVNVTKVSVVVNWMLALTYDGRPEEAYSDQDQHDLYTIRLHAWSNNSPHSQDNTRLHDSRRTEGKVSHAQAWSRSHADRQTSPTPHQEPNNDQVDHTYTSYRRTSFKLRRPRRKCAISRRIVWT